MKLSDRYRCILLMINMSQQYIKWFQLDSGSIACY